MSQELVLALDQGSSSSRALAIDSRGKVVARAQFPIKTYTPQAGWMEHEALEIAKTQEKALDAVLSQIPQSAKILGLGLAAQRSTVIFWDKETGRPACRAPSWQDGRAADIAAGLQRHQREAHEKTGLYLTPYYSAPKIRWFLDHNEQVRRLADAGRLLAGPVSSFLIWRMTRGAVFAADPTMAQRMMLLNLRSLDWDESLLKLFSIPREILPSLTASAGALGFLERRGRKIPILAALGDQQAANVGLGAEEGSSLVNYGTGAFFILNTGAAQHRVAGLLTSVGYKLEGEPPVFLQEGTVHSAGSSFDWLKNNFGLLKNQTDIDRLCRSSKHRVWALQAIGGLGAPRWDYAAKTVFFGLTSQSRPADIVRGVTEGVAFLIADIVEALREGGLKPAFVRAAGGLSRSSYLMQFQADLLQTEIRRCREAEMTALGVASLAAKAAGADWSGFKISQDRVFKPVLSAARAGRLLGDWKRFVSVEAALSREISFA